MAFDIVHQQAVYRTFRASTCSSAYFVKILFRWLDITIPLFIIFATHGLWKKRGEFSEVPHVKFEGKFLAICQAADQYALSSSFAVLNSADPSSFVLSQTSFQWTEKEHHRELNINIDIPVGNLSIDTLTYFVFLNYRLDYHSIIQANLALADTVQFTSNPESLSVYGRLRANQVRPFGSDTSYVLVDENRRDVEHYKPQEIMRRMAAMDLSLAIDTKTFFLQPKTSSSERFSLSLTVIVAEDHFMYSTDFWELIKWAWIQYLAVFVVIRYLSNLILDNFYSNRVLEAIPGYINFNTDVISQFK